MNKIVKISLITISTIIALIIASLIALMQLINPNDYKEHIQKLAFDKANINLNINGDINWSFYPYLGFNINDTDLTDATTSYKDKPLAKFNNIGIALELLPLFKKQLNISNVYIDGLNVNIIFDKQGKSNFDGILQVTNNKNNDQNNNKDNISANINNNNEITNNDNKQDNKNDINFLVKVIKITNTNLNYINEQNKQTIKVNDFNLITDAITFDKPVKLKLDGKLKFNNELNALFESNLNITFNNEFNKIVLDVNNLIANVTSNLINNKTAKISLQTKVNFNQENNNINLKVSNFKFKLNDLITNINVDIKNATDVIPIINGSLNIEQFNAKKLLLSLGQELPLMANSDSLNKVIFSLKFGNLLDKNSKLTNDLEFSNIKLILDQTDITGNINLEAFNVKNPGLKNINLNIDQINLDNYLPPPNKQTDNNAANTNNNNQPFKWSDELLFDANLLFGNEILFSNKHGLNNQIKIGKLTINKVPINNILVDLKLNKNALNINKIYGDIYNGNFNINVNLANKTKKNNYQLTSNLNIKNLPIANFVETFIEKVDKSPITGNLNLTAKLTTQGLSEQQIINNLNGTANLTINDATINKVNLDLYACEAISLVNRKQLDKSELKQNSHTVFKQLGGNFIIKNGVVNNSNLTSNIAGFNLNGRGLINLNNLTLDYVAGLIIEGKDDVAGGACEISKRYVGIEWPVKCSGELMDIGSACKIDVHALGKVIEKLAKDELNKKLKDKLGDKNLKEAVKDKLEEKLEEKLHDKIDVDEVKDKAKDKLKGKLKKLVK